MKMFEGKNVLVLDGNSRQILPVLHGLSQLGCNITTFCESKLDNGYASKYVSKKILISEPDREAYYKRVLDELKTNKYDVLLALSDALMDMMTQHENEIKQHVKFPFASREVFMMAYNKQFTMEACMNEHIPCPITKYEGETLDEIVSKIGFPLIAKPRMACGSMGLKIVKDRKQLDSLIADGTIELDKYVIQEFIPQTGKQINVHLFMDDDGNLKSGIVTEKTRWYPVDGGASCLCRTIHNDAVLADCEKLLKSINWRSYCEIELIEDPRDGQYKIMEINGRASASIKIMDLAGVNVAEQMMQLSYCEEVAEAKDYKNDVRMRRLSADCLWFLQAKDRFSRKPSWFSLKNTHEVTFSAADPKPFFATGLKLVTELGTYKKEMQKRKRT